MTLTATVTSKGQLTLPKPLRDAFRLRAGSRVVFTLNEDGAFMKPETCPVDELYGVLKLKGQKPVPVDKMNAAIRRRMAESAR